MGGLFGSMPQAKVPDPPPPPPQVDESAAAADERQRLAQRKGRLATLFTGTSGAPLTGQARASTLLGQAGASTQR
jgi:hypothetical protein